MTTIHETRGGASVKIGQIFDKIDDKQLFVPAFQREYIWREHAKDLIYGTYFAGL
ncbi:hypothetical protein [Mariprofundus ferrooxydans]|nr:hypothetical protein [Mariprofundus ferrooxydans]